MSLPPGQRALDHFPRFGTHLHDPPPPAPEAPAITVVGAGRDTLRLDDFERRELQADFHCVAGWSVTGLRWEGVWFRDVFASLDPVHAVTHVAFVGHDGYRSVVELADALAADVLLADRLDGEPLTPDHGAPVRLVSPSQYGFVSTKHLCRIELHAREPSAKFGGLPAWKRLGLHLVEPHPRARVWEEERHRHLPAWALRPIYQRLIAPIRSLSARG